MISFCSNQAPCGKYQSGNMVRYAVDSNCQIYADWDTANNIKTVNGYEADFDGKQQCSDDSDVQFTSQFNFLCYPNAGTLGKLQAIRTGSNICNYQVDIYTNLVCEGSVPIGGGGGGEGEGLSGGSIFLVTLVGLIFGYVIVGVVLNYVKEKALRAPHKTFWCGKLPYWTKTGCGTSWLCTIRSYRWCCKKIFRSKPQDDKMATGLIGEAENN